MATLIVGNGSHGQDIGATCYGAEFVPHHSVAPQLPYDEYQHIYIGSAYPKTRAGIADVLGIEDASWVHPLAYVERSTYGHGTHINYGAMMTRTRIGVHVTISPCAVIAGDVRIGDRVLIGAGAVICDRVTVGNDVTVGAGAVVLPETVIPDGETWVGVPARRV